MRGRRGAGIALAVNAYAGAAGQLEGLQRAAGGSGLALGVQGFGVDAPLDRIALRRRRVAQLQAAQTAPGRHGNLQLHQVQAADGLGHRVLDLQARIGLDEHIGQVRRSDVDEELEGAQALVTHGARHAQRGLRQLLAQRLRQAGTGCDLDQLLEAPLQAAFALAQRDDFRAIAQHLDFDVARIAHQALHIDAINAKRSARLGHAAGIGVGQLFGAQHGAHAAPTAPTYGLDHDAGLAALLRGKKVLRLGQRHRLLRAGHQRHLLRHRQRARLALVAKQRELGRRRADEADAGTGAGLGEIGALAEKTVARMDGVAAMQLGNLQQPRNVQVGHRAHHAQGNLAAVGDQNFVEHAGFQRSLSKRRNTLPAPVAGKASMKRTSRGTLYGAMLWRDQAISSAASCAAPGLATMKAHTTSPLSGSGLAITAAWATAGCLIRMVSTSSGNTL